MNAVVRLADSLSGLVNRLTGTGTTRDKLMAASWFFQQPDDLTLQALYRSTWVAKKLVDIPIDDMLREGWTWQAGKSDITKLEEEEKRLGIPHKLHQALVRDAIYGGAAFLLGDGAPDPAEPIDPAAIGRGGLRYVLVVGRTELEVKEFSLDIGENYGQPAMFRLVPQRGNPVDVHSSRVIPFVRNPVVTNYPAMSSDSFWGDSRLASVMRDIAGAMSGVAGVSRLMDELAIAYHKIHGFTDIIATTDGEEQVRRVLDLAQRTKSAINAVAIDAEDDVDVITASFTGIPEAIRSLMQNVSGAGDIPLTRFLGSSPDGMNATGASDIRNYYDRLKGERSDYVAPGMERLDQFLIPSALGAPSTDVWRVWNPLWQMTEQEQVELDKNTMAMLNEMHAAGRIHDHVIEQVTRNIMIDSPTFKGAEKAFEEADEMPDPTPEEVAAASQLQASSSGQPPATAGDPPPRLRVAGGTDVGDEQPFIPDGWTLEDVKAWMSQPRHPAGSSKGGQWSGGPSQSNYGPQLPSRGGASMAEPNRRWSTITNTAPDTSHGRAAQWSKKEGEDPTPDDVRFAAKHLEFAEPVIVVPHSAMIRIVEEGILPAVEVGRSTRAYDPQERVGWEDNIFGSTGRRPVYGALDTNDETSGRLVRYGYGAAVVRLKPEAMANATATWGDSLNANGLVKDDFFKGGEEKGREYGTGISRPFKPNDMQDAAGALSTSNYGSRRASDVAPMEYVELQFWGGVRAEHIESVTFTRHSPSPILVKKMNERGIKWVDDSQAQDSAIVDFTGQALARNPDTGAMLVDAGKNEQGDQLAYALSSEGVRSGTQLLASFLKFGGWELE